MVANTEQRYARLVRRVTQRVCTQLENKSMQATTQHIRDHLRYCSNMSEDVRTLEHLMYVPDSCYI